MTHRQFVAWVKWKQYSLNNPGISELYLAQVAVEVRRVLSTNPQSIQLDDMILKFKDPKPPSKEDIEEFSKRAIAAWTSKVGGKVKVMKPEEVTYIYPTKKGTK